MPRRLILYAALILLALFLLPRPYPGREVPAGDVPPLVLAPAQFRQPADDLLDLNTATAEQLQSLPGIGPVRAQSIVDYRVQNGPFQSPEELSAVDGIGMGLLDQIRDLITVQTQED